jgi:hypothetical protein
LFVERERLKLLRGMNGDCESTGFDVSRCRSTQDEQNVILVTQEAVKSPENVKEALPEVLSVGKITVE